MISYTIQRESSVPELLWKCTDNRITRETKHAFTQNGGLHRHIIMVARKRIPGDTEDLILGTAGVAYTEGAREWWHAFVIVSVGFRNLGIGTALLNRRLIEQAKLFPHLVRESFVASDNVASVHMCEKASLLRMSERTAERRDGTFIQYRFIDSEVI